MTVGSLSSLDVHKIAALGDLRRREILEALSHGACSVAELAERLPVTRSAVSQHLGVLQEAGLVRHEKIGTRHLYQVDPEGVAALRSYLDSLWARALSSFKAAAENPLRQKAKSPRGRRPAPQRKGRRR
jgi:DNA-binding transcriptional ArsR family regulator